MVDTRGRDKFLEIHTSSSVLPLGNTPIHSICLANTDLLGMLMSYTPVIYLYKHNGSHDFFSTEALKAALSKVLVPFYPYAGELVYDERGVVELRCNAKGVLFVSASFDMTMEEFGDFSPSPLLSRLFLSTMPSAKPPCPIAVFQVTRFKCGGVCLATALHHMIGDATSSLHFINAWADVSRGCDLSTIRPPLLDRSLIKPRSPLRIQFPHDEYSCPTVGFDNRSPQTSVVTSTVTLELSACQVADLKVRGGVKYTVSTAVIAHAWRCACKARRLRPDLSTRFYMAADVRSRLHPPLPFEFLGNAILHLTVESSAGSTMDEFARKIELVKSRLNDDYLRSLIDYVASKEPSSFRPILPPSDIVVVNWLNVAIYNTDFGWGKPYYVHRSGGCNNGDVHVLRNFDEGKGGLLVTATLEQECMPDFKRLFYEELNEDGSKSCRALAPERAIIRAVD